MDKLPEHVCSKIAMMAHPIHPCKWDIDDFKWGYDPGLINTPLQARLIMWPCYFDEEEEGLCTGAGPSPDQLRYIIDNFGPI